MPSASTAPVPAGERIAIKTDLYTADIDTLGGVIDQVALARHRDTQDEAKPYVLLQRNAERTFIAQSGLLGDGMPNHRTLWQALPGPRELAAGVDSLEVKLQAAASNGDKVVQTLTFHRGSYVIEVTYDITNAGSSVREVPRLRVALRNPDERETQFKIIDPPTARLGPGETAHFKTSFDNADETATVKVSFVPR